NTKMTKHVEDIHEKVDGIPSDKFYDEERDEDFDPENVTTTDGDDDFFVSENESEIETPEHKKQSDHIVLNDLEQVLLRLLFIEKELLRDLAEHKAKFLKTRSEEHTSE